ncbi:MAG: UDP-N-acetylmuramoyl-L-alanyl-D-glutamate--2,6-diaminopimelate ligase [Oscillospiraceae bacterium]|nr:UDP-N-acetylmuramoyl-L-alanyl-D-glutamate--2,6-diaminopimelate ligase [Oscillospiraceae bacterium]
MKLSKLIENIAVTTLPNIEITDISSDTRKPLKEGGMFVCIKGNTFDGHDSAEKMLQSGAAVVVVERDLGLKNQIIVPDSRRAFTKLCAAWFSHPERELKLVGVTGTNGKTTTTTVLKSLLTKMGYKVGLIGTCQNEIGDEIYHTERTTPEAYDLFELFRNMADKKCDYCVMEVSSQGLEQGRVDGCMFETATFTNLTQDHLDVHGTMENYYGAKKIIFSLCKKAVINTDTDYGRRYFSEIDCEKISFGEKNADLTASDIKLSANGVSYTCTADNESCKVDFAMPGDFNVSNSLGVIATMKALGFDTKKTAGLLREFGGVRGRAEVVETGRDFTVICDYAHTPDAIENILSAIKSSADGRVVCLFGCGGNRDARKRPLMAKAAADNADFVIVTSDNPRNEDPEAIIKDVLEGIKDTKTPYVTIADRREAIHWAVKNAQPKDVIVLCGKGHEDYQILAGGVKIHFDEREVVMEALSELE